MSSMRPPIVAGPISRNFRLEIDDCSVFAGVGTGVGAGVGVAAATGVLPLGVGLGFA